MDTKSPFRFSLRTLLLAVVAVSVGTAAMVSASEWWQAIAATTAVGLLIAAILLVAYRSGSSRAYWSGFAVSSGMYLFLVYLGSVPMLPGMLVNLLADVMHKGPNLATAAPMTYYPPTLAPAPAAPSSPGFYPTNAPTILAPIPGPTEDAQPEPNGSEPEGGCTTSTNLSNCGSGNVDEVVQQVPADDSCQSTQISDDSGTEGYTMPLTQTQSSSTVIYSSTSAAPAYVQTTYDDFSSRRQRCIAIGHYLSAIIFGIIGGCFAVWLHATRERCANAACGSTTTE